MKVLGLVGSPRKRGNTDILVERVLEGARERGAETEKIYLADLELRFCRGCGVCNRAKPWPGCVQDDGMTRVVHPALAACDAFVVGTPVYFFGPSAQTKLFLDRWMALIDSDDGGARPHALRGKRMVVAAAYGDSNPRTSGLDNALGTFRDAAAYMGVRLHGVVHSTAGEKGAMSRNRRALEEAFELGRRLVEARP